MCTIYEAGLASAMSSRPRSRCRVFSLPGGQNARLRLQKSTPVERNIGFQAIELHMQPSVGTVSVHRGFAVLCAGVSD